MVLDGLFLYDGPQILASGVTAALAETLGPVDERVTATAVPIDVITWQTVPDISFTQGSASTHDVSSLVSDTQSLPIRITLLNGVLPTGVTYNEAQKRFEYDGAGAVATDSGIVLRAISGSYVSVSEAIGAVVEVMTATASQGSITGSVATIAEVLPAVSEAINVDATGVGPSGTRYPNREPYGSLTQAERFFGDTDTPTARYSGTDQYVYADGSKTNNGWYCGGMDYVNTGENHGNSVTRRWRTKGGDWYGKTGVYRDTTQANAFALSSTINNANGEQLVTISGVDLVALVNTWVAGSQPNYGLRLDLTNGNAAWIRSRFATDSTKWPTMTVTTTNNGTVTLSCARSQWMVNDDTPRPKYQYMQITGNSTAAWVGLLAFDTSSLTGTVTAVTINLWAYQFFPASSGTEQLRVWQLWNPNDYVATPYGPGGYPGWTLPPVELGISAVQGNADANLIAHPQVLFVEDFSVTDIANARYYQNAWDNGSQPWVGATQITAATDTNGYFKLFGTQNALKVGPSSSGTDTPGPAVVDAHWYPQRGAKSYHAKPLQNVDDLYIRWYFLLGANYDPWPNGTKIPGFGGLFDSSVGMGRGSGGSGADGLTGYSTRGSGGSIQGIFPDAAFMNATYTSLANYDTSGTPLDRLVGYGGWNDAYSPDMSTINGPYEGFGTSYLNCCERLKWHCMEQRLKVNSVTDPTAKSKRINSGTSNGTVGTYNLAAPDPSLFVGQVISLGGFTTGPAGAPYQGWFGSPNTTPSWRTIVAVGAMSGGDSTTWWFKCGDAASPVNTTSPAQATSGGFMVYCTSLGNHDGILEMWMNGRKTYSRTDYRVRHSAWCTDGVTPFGVDGIWFSIYLGGQPNRMQTIFNYFPSEHYYAHFVAATGYIGPAVGYGGP